MFGFLNVFSLELTSETYFRAKSKSGSACPCLVFPQKRLVPQSQCGEQQEIPGERTASGKHPSPQEAQSAKAVFFFLRCTKGQKKNRCSF